jgi:hypothetical protein
MLRVLLIKTPAGQRRDSPIGRGEGVFQALLVHDHYLGLRNDLLLRELIFLWKMEQQVWAKTMIDDLLTDNSAVSEGDAKGLGASSRLDQGRFFEGSCASYL